MNMKAGEVQGNERELSSFLVRASGAHNLLVEFASMLPFEEGYLIAGSR